MAWAKNTFNNNNNNKGKVHFWPYYCNLKNKVTKHKRQNL